MVFLLCCLGASVAGAQLDPIAPVLEGPGEDRPQPERLEPEPQEARPGARILPRIEIPPGEPGSGALAGASIEVRAFAFEGNTVFSDAQLERVVASYTGGTRRYADILEARDRITRAYIDAGYLNSGAVLPDQDFADGLVRIVVVEGAIDAIQITTNGRLRDHYFTSRLESLEVLDIYELRERLRRLKRDPGIDAIAAELLPGRERGRADLLLTIDESEPWNAAVTFDNQVAQSVGGLRGRASAGHRNLTGWGERVQLSYAHAEELRDIDFRIDAPVTRYDTKLEVFVRRAWSAIVQDEIDRLSDDDDDIDKIESDTIATGFRVRQPLVTARGVESNAFVGFDWKEADTSLTIGSGEEFTIGDPDNEESTVSVFVLGADGRLRFRERAFAARITGRFGADILGATDDPSEGFADGKFSAALFQLQAIEFLPWYDLRVHTRLDGQVASGQLLGLERFAFGGRTTVRGYRHNLVVKDEGFVGSVELRVPLPTVGYLERFELGVFSDVGYGRNKRSGDRVSDTLWGVGLGLHANFAYGIRASLEWAKDLEGTDGIDGNELQDKGLHFALALIWP